MRYAIFTDVHANLEALEAVLAKIDELAQERPIDQIWYLGDLVGYGPDPNECISLVRERTDVIIAGNHDWAAIGKLSLEDFSEAARISAEWTAEQLTEEHRTFLADLPERLEIGECTLVHGSPYGPLWEYLTSEILAERSFQYFNSRYCFVGHTHIPAIFQQPDTISNAPTLPLVEPEPDDTVPLVADEDGNETTGEIDEDDQETATHQAITPSQMAAHAESAYINPQTGQPASEQEANAMIEAKVKATEKLPAYATGEEEEQEAGAQDMPHDSESVGEAGSKESEEEDEGETTPESAMLDAEEHLDSEIEELLALLGLSESMIQVTNEMLVPPEGHWEAPPGYRAIINPGGVGQPRDGDPRAAFMIYDTEEGFEFYRVAYPFKKTQEKIIKAGLPQYLALRLAYGR